MKIHPICEVFPAMQPDEQKALVQSMVANGYDTDQPVVMFEKMILDGRHRHNAAEEAGVKAVYVEFKGDMDDAVRFVEQRNLRRRHLTVGQRAMVAAGLESYHKADAQERQRGGVRADPPEGSGVGRVATRFESYPSGVSNAVTELRSPQQRTAS